MRALPPRAREKECQTSCRGDPAGSWLEKSRLDRQGAHDAGFILFESPPCCHARECGIHIEELGKLPARLGVGKEECVELLHRRRGNRAVEIGMHEKLEFS